MSFEVYMQRVLIFWTKKSRGMPGAEARNQCPKSFTISEESIDGLLAGGSYSSVIMREGERFLPSQRVEPLSQFKGEPETVSIKQVKGKRIVVYRYISYLVGAPDRSNRPNISCEIKPGELLRIEYNGRFSDPCFDWHYGQKIFNIVYTDNLVADSFLARPDHYINDLAELL